VLVTGGTGFIGAHIVDQLLERGIEVRLAVRSSTKGEQFVKARPELANKIEVFEIPDFENEAAANPFTEAAQGVDGVIHTASPFRYNVTDVEKELVRPAINGAKMMLEACNAAKSVERLVLTSSFASVLDVTKNPGPTFKYTAKDWNPITYEEAIHGTPLTAYRGSKKFAELAAWDFVKDKQRHFDLVTFCPPMVFGPVVHPVASIKELNESNYQLWKVAAGEDPLPEARVPVWIDVRDLAKAHVEGLLRPEVGGRRYVLCAKDKFSYEKAAKILHELGLGHPTDNYDKSRVELESFGLDYDTAAKDLGLTYRTFDETVEEAISQFLELDNK
jgi:nucleoside-diphosphate-sugar epimerase